VSIDLPALSTHFVDTERKKQRVTDIFLASFHTSICDDIVKRRRRRKRRIGCTDGFT
jgi:hypothetical protein